MYRFRPTLSQNVCYWMNRDELDSLLAINSRTLSPSYFWNVKPFRCVKIEIESARYSLYYNDVKWHPNRADYTIQQFLAGQRIYDGADFYSFAEMRPYLGPTVLVKEVIIFVAGDFTYNREQIEQLESLAPKWRDFDIRVVSKNQTRIVADDFQRILSSPTILQCRYFSITDPHFSFTDYNVFLRVKYLEVQYTAAGTVDPVNWFNFLEQPGVKPIVGFKGIETEKVNNILDRLCEAFSAATVLRNSYTLVFMQVKPLVECVVTNFQTYEKLELKKGFPINSPFEAGFYDFSYTYIRYYDVFLYDPNLMPFV